MNIDVDALSIRKPTEMLNASSSQSTKNPMYVVRPNTVLEIEESDRFSVSFVTIERFEGQLQSRVVGAGCDRSTHCVSSGSAHWSGGGDPIIACDMGANPDITNDTRNMPHSVLSMMMVMDACFASTSS